MQIDKIKTKFNIGEKVYFLHNDSITSGKIYLIEINLTVFNGTIIREIYYKIADINDRFIGTFTEELLYESELELITG